MPSQDEVLQAAKELGYWFNYPRLKRYFGLEKFTGEHHGSSNLSARVKKLHERGYLVKFKVPGGVVYLVPPEHYDVTPADEFLYYARGERGEYALNQEILQRIQNALWDESQNISTIAKRAGVKWHTAARYLKHLVEQGLIFEISGGKEKIYTVFSPNFN